MAFQPVTKQHPCEVCGKPDWCLYTPDGELAICPRTHEGPSFTENTKAGPLHRLRDAPEGPRVEHKRRKEPDRPKIDARALALGYCSAITSQQIVDLGQELGVTPASLDLLRVGWCEEKSAYTFPMRDGNREIIGIRTREESGHRAITGSKAGLFIPHNWRQRKFFIVEGPSDTAMMLSLGIPTIGRPSCDGGVEQIIDFCKRQKIKSGVTIIADNDEPNKLTGKRPGRDGAVRLFKALGFGEITSPPKAFKDVREAVRQMIARLEDIYEDSLVSGHVNRRR